MPGTRTITLALQDGFADDTVEISIAGKVIEHLDHVSTRTQIGVARELTVTVPAETTTLKIALPDRNIEQDVDASGDEHLGVSVDPSSGRITVRRSAEPFGYV